MPQEQLLGPSTIVREGTKSSTLGRLGGPWCTRRLQEGGIYKEEPAASRQTYSAAVVGFRHRQTTQRYPPSCWPLGAFKVKVSEVSFYCIAITQFHSYLFCICFPQTHPIQFCITLISYWCFLVTSSFLFLTSWKIKKTAVKLKSQQMISSRSSFPLTHLSCFSLLGLNYLGFLGGIRLVGLGLLLSL